MQEMTPEQLEAKDGVFIPVGEPFEEAPKSFLNYIGYRRLDSKTLSVLVSEFMKRRKEKGLSHTPFSEEPSRLDALEERVEKLS